VQHGAVMTGRQLVHMPPEAIHHCLYCSVDYKILRHYFWILKSLRILAAGWRVSGLYPDIYCYDHCLSARKVQGRVSKSASMEGKYSKPRGMARTGHVVDLLCTSLSA
jgi:hypothetical protein